MSRKFDKTVKCTLLGTQVKSKYSGKGNYRFNFIRKNIFICKEIHSIICMGQYK